MNITPDLVKKVAENARLKLKDEEIKKFAEQMKEILSTFEKLSEVNTQGIEPSFHPIPIKNVCREDVPGPCTPREDALALTMHRQDPYFKGPKVIQP